jgi:hypothetical protein
MNDINSDSELVDKPIWWKRIWAGVGDVISMCLNAVANLSFLTTAFTEKAVDRLLVLIDYQRTPLTTSTGGVFFYIKRAATFPFTVAIGDVVAYSESSSVVSSMRFEATAAVTFTAVTEAAVSASAATDKWTVAQTYKTGELIQFTTATSLPTAVGGNLAVATDYYVIYVSATEIRIARTLALAYAGTYIDMTSAGVGAHAINRFSKSVTMYQQKTTSNYVVGTSDGITEWQEYILPDKGIIRSTVVVSINAVTWTRVDTFVYSGVADTHFKVNFMTDGTVSIMMGDGVYGAIPGAFPIYVTYAVGGGLVSNVSTLGKINVYGGSDSNITGVSNYEAFTGGGDKESIESAKIIAPILLKTRDRFITVEDGETLAFNYGGIARVNIVKNYYGLLSCMCIIVPNGGGAPSGSLKTAIDTYLTDRSILGSIDVRVVDPTYVATPVSIGVKMLTGFVFATIDPMIQFAIKLLVSESTYEIQQYLISNGISSTVTYINTLWTFSFTAADYNEIIRLVELVKAPNFGENIEQSDFYALLDSVTGVDYITIALPAAFPVTFTASQISQIGAITTVEL